MINKVIIFVLMQFTLIANSAAKDLGKMGQTFEIKEEPFIEMMKRRAKGIDMEKEKKKMQELAKERIDNPTPVAGISPATEDRTIYFDPTYTLDQDAVLPCGKILHKAGTKVNPLEHENLNRRMFFIDGREESQVEWLKEQLSDHLPEQNSPVEDRIILVGGSPFKIKEELAKTREREVYFDQISELTTRFAINYSPAIAVQEGLKIRIDEVNLNNKK
jgi:conjugal transfer pilus assembly protein TraW